MRYDKVKEKLKQRLADLWDLYLDQDNTWSSRGDLIIQKYEFTKLPLQFGHIQGSFNCNFNQLTSLEGAPKVVDGHFSANNNQLTNLEHLPQKIGGSILLEENELTCIQGLPETVNNTLSLFSNKLTSLEGCSKTVLSSFSCSRNLLTSLDGAPTKTRTFYCKNNLVVFEKPEWLDCGEFIPTPGAIIKLY